jgi:peroxiredoxin
VVPGGRISNSTTMTSSIVVRNLLNSYTLIIPFKTFLLLPILLISTCLLGQIQNQKFTITGQLQGFSNGTIIYLNDVSDGNYKKIDSAFIKHNKFNFVGYIKTKYLKSSLTSSDYNDRVTFWLEKGLTTFEGEKGKFVKAKVAGSTMQIKWNELTHLLDTAKNREQTEYLFIKVNPKSIISAYSLTNNFRTWSMDTIASLYKLFSKEVKQTKYGRRVNSFISLNRNIKIGDKFVDFTQKDSSNKIIKLSNLKGKIVLLEFWGSWCYPCREENPILEKIYKEYNSKGFEIFGVASETDKEQWIKAIKTDGLTWTNTSDLKGSDNQVALIYGVTGFPTNFLIDKSGIIIAKDIYGDELKKLLFTLLR